MKLRLLAIGIATALAAAPAASSAVTIVKIRYNPPGTDTRAKLNAEWVRLKNTGKRSRSLAGWVLRDAAGHVYRFDPGYRLGAGRSVLIHTGGGRDSARHRYWGQHAYVWNNDRDRATLKNARGRVIDRCSYRDSSASARRC